MGTILSEVAEIENIRWKLPKKGAVLDAKRILFISETSAIIELSDGSFTVAGQRHSVNGKWAVMNYGLDDFTQAVLYGMVRIGVLKKEGVKAHIASATTRHEARERKYNINSLRRICEELKIPMPEITE